MLLLCADYSLGLSRVYFSTFENIVVDYNFDRRTSADPYFGHHGISVGRGRDNLLSGFNIRASQVRKREGDQWRVL